MTVRGIKTGTIGIKFDHCGLVCAKVALESILITYFPYILRYYLLTFSCNNIGCECSYTV